MAKKNYTYNPPVKSVAPKKPKEQTQGQIRTLFEPTVILDEMSISETNNPKKENQATENLMSISYPLIMINGYTFNINEVISVDIDSTKKVPEISLTLSFGDEQFFSRYLPKDGDIISIMIRSKSGLLKPIRNDYVITSILSNKKNEKGSNIITLNLYGKLFVPGLDSYLEDKIRASYKTTTLFIVKYRAKKLYLGFSTNETETDDYQIWYKTKTPAEFIDHLVKHSWKDETSFFDWWIDIYYNLNFINVQNQLLKSEDEIDDAVLISNVEKDYYFGNDDEVTAETAKVFSNYYTFKNSSFFIVNWRPINKSSAITFEYGTSLNTSFFEHNNKLYEDPNSDLYWKLNISPAYDPNKLEDHILLRGRAKYDPEKNPVNEQAKANYNYNEIYKKAVWEGIQYTISDPDKSNLEWNGNHYKNFKRSIIQNLINKVELNKLNIEINVNGLNLNIIKGDKLPVVLIKHDSVETLLMDNEAKTDNYVDSFYSGWYYIKGLKIKYTSIDNDDPNSTNFYQRFILTRREWPLPEPVIGEK